MSVDVKKLKVSSKSRTSINSIAGTLLLPETVLNTSFRTVDLSAPGELRRLADTALISKQALVRRIQSLRHFPHPVGLIACVHRRQDGRSVIDSVSRHYSLRQIFTKAKEGESLDRPLPIACPILPQPSTPITTGLLTSYHH